IGVGVYAHAEPRDGIASQDADEAARDDNRHGIKREMPQAAVIDDYDDGKHKLENKNKFTLRYKIGFAGFVNQFRYFAHGFMHGHRLDSHELHHAEHKAEYAYQQSPEKKGMAVHAKEIDGFKIRQDKIALACEHHRYTHHQRAQHDKKALH